MIDDLKKFLFKDNLIDLAVAVILGAAFGAVVKSVVDDLLMPVIAAIVGKPNFDDIQITLTSWASDGAGHRAGDPRSVLEIGQFLTVFVNVVIVGTVLFFILRAIQKVMARGKAAEVETATPSDEVILLTEIRDHLAKRP